MRLRRTNAQPAAISLVSMIDVLMILLIFFMVTSTYLDLGMIPMAERKEDAQAQAASSVTDSTVLLIRLGPDGRPRVRGKIVEPEALTAALRTHVARQPDASVLVLPSGNANAQALVSLLDQATGAGVENLRILRVEAAP